MFSRKRVRSTAAQPAGDPNCAMCGSPTTVDADGRCPLGHRVTDPQMTTVVGPAPEADAAPEPEAGPEPEPAQPLPTPPPGMTAPPVPAAPAEPVPAPRTEAVPAPRAEPVPEAPAAPVPAPQAEAPEAPDPAPQPAVDDDVAAGVGRPSDATDGSAPLRSSSFLDDWDEIDAEDATLPDSVLDFGAPERNGGEHPPTSGGDEEITEARERLLQAASWFSTQDE